ncbi:MAG: efflux RND transporter periplasmic adaptor subunit [Opitutales bacterium]|nr:efflux RND transporter periplasmic adaptor subunit [Opitutales bacterium]
MKKRKKKSWLKRVVIILVVLAGIGTFGAIKAGSAPKGIEVTSGKSVRGDITSVVTATGKIHPQAEVKLSSEVSGEIIELPVRDGESVKKGDLLFRVNTDTLEAQVKQQEAALSATKANSAQNKAQMELASLNLKRIENLAEKGFVTEDELDQARTNMEVAKAAYEASVFQIARQEMQLKEAMDALGKASTYAPIDGTVTILNAESGDRVVGTGQFAGTEILRLANLSAMEVRVDVAETDIINVKVGDQADIEIDSLPNEKFAGVVSEIANSANTANMGSQEQLTTFQVRVRFDKADNRFRPGMTATADIRTKSEKDVVLVPLQSVTVRQKTEVREQLKLKPEKDGDETKEGAPAEPKNPDAGKEPSDNRKENARDSMQRVVFVIRDGKAILTQVETGIADSRNIQIVSGLDEGQTIVTGNYGVLTRELKHESMVRVKENGSDKDGKAGPKGKR